MHKSIKNLEFSKIIDQLQPYANCSLGREAIGEIELLTDLDTITAMLDETEEALRLLYQIGDIPFGGISDIRPHIRRSVIGGMLNAHELLDIFNFIYGVSLMKSYLNEIANHHIEVALINQYIENLQALPQLRKAIGRCIDENGRVVDDASENLRRIRNQMKTVESRIKDQLQSIINTKRDVLTDTIVTIRNDRFVVPVRVDYKNRFEGIVHDQSQSGNTVYIEPKAVVESNNQLNHLMNDEKEEIERILRALTKEVAAQEEELKNNAELAKTLDFIYAKAKYARALDAIKPKVNDRGIIKIYKGRHPLIDPKVVVSNDIFLGEGFQAMVITGPNTGGKTVTLKTVGIFTLMMQAGLLIPANEPTELAVFDQIFSDIGDEQSIEQSLSTFSSHMTNIVDIVKNYELNSLILFDELGAGTDPKEGAALAISILDYFILRGARIIATTHYPELKSYAYNQEKVINASVEFNIETLSPTYRLLIGVPGRSNALEISRRLGLDERILSSAKEKIETEKDDVANLIQKLENQGLYLEKLVGENETLKNRLDKERQEINDQKDKLQERKDTLLEKARLEAVSIIQEAKEEAEEVIRELRELKKNQQINLKEHELIEFKSKLKTEKYYEKEEVQPTDPRHLKAGQTVKVLSLNRTGKLLEKVNEEEWIVQIGILNSRVNQKLLQYVPEQSEHKGPDKAQTNKVKVVKQSKASFELDLRGERYEEAMRKLDKFMDTALVNNLRQVSIIHGHGTGALRTGVQSYLKKNRNVKEFRFGGEGEGGLGVTVVTFK